MQIYFLVIFSLYYFVILLFILGWKKKGELSLINEKTLHDFISVIVVVRNEQEHIAQLLESLSNQTLQKSQFELIIIDDDSNDRTAYIVEQFIEDNIMDVRLMKLESIKRGSSPKKSGITQAVAHAKGEIIAMTDGDCKVGTHWLETILHSLQQDGVKFVSGPLILNGQNNLISKIQVVEFASLIGTGGALINLNYPLMCNGANLAFRKSAFLGVNGYKGNIDSSTGDDVFLMQKIHQAYANSIRFLKDPKAIVSTGAQKSWSELIHQRKRWASKWNKNLLPLSWFLPVFLFIQYITILIGVLVIIIKPDIFWGVGLLLCIKFILDYVFLKKVMIFCNLRLNYSMFLLSELIYPFYAVFFGTIVHFGNFTWKGRSHKN